MPPPSLRGGRPRGGPAFFLVAFVACCGGCGLAVPGGESGHRPLALPASPPSFQRSAPGPPQGVVAARALVVADMDGDADLDVLAGGDGESRLLLGDGRGGLATAPAGALPASVALGRPLRSLVAGDMDGDGDTDVVLVPDEAQTAVELAPDRDAEAASAFPDQNQGLAKFAMKRRTGSASLALVAFDLSGIPAGVEVLSASLGLYHLGPAAQGAILSAYQILGPWTETQVTYNNRPPRAAAPDGTLAIGDASVGVVRSLDLTSLAAAWLDGAVAHHGVVVARTDVAGADLTVYSRENGTPPDPARAPRLSLVYRHRPLLLRNRGPGAGAGTFDLVPLTALAGGASRAVLLLDANGDGRPDLYLSREGGPDLLALGDGAGGFAPAPAAVPVSSVASVHAAAADLDGDGDPEIYVAVRGGRDRLLMNGGGGVYTDEGATRLPAAADLDSGRVVLADLDGDGDLDVFLAGTLGAPDRLLVNLGGAVFADGSAERLPGGAAAASPAAAFAARLDADGDLDLVVLDGAAAGLRVLVNDGGGRFTALAGGLPSPVAAAGAALGDLDRDGHLDLYIGAATAGGDELWLGR
ncbi:MAG: VCBS repeat-containing protein [Planctomycetes bacterium]|nr:VCBS repeat-containing protein [Planctomycetota bacterium]